MGRVRDAIRVGTMIAMLMQGSVAKGQAPCVGDCDGTHEVAVTELVIGVGIALGEQPVSACPSFANAQGVVDVAQLIIGVRAALQGCLPPVTLTESVLPTVTPTATPSLAPDTPTATETPTPIPQDACVFQPGRCIGGSNDGRDCVIPLECPDGQCDRFGPASRLEINIAALPTPLTFVIRGRIDVDTGAAQPQGLRTARCVLRRFEPLNIPCIGFTCINSTIEPCPDGVVDCDGGTPLSLDIVYDGDIGACDGQDACAAACETACANRGGVRESSGCTGYCTAGTQAGCSMDADCVAELGQCSGPDPVGGHAGICQCACVTTGAGDPGRPGELRCNLGVALVIERSAPCDGTDVDLALSSACIPLTSARVTSVIRNANFNPPDCPAGAPPCMVPVDGPIDNRGNPLACAEYDTGVLDGLQLVGVANSFGSALGDVASELSVTCK